MRNEGDLSSALKHTPLRECGLVGQRVRVWCVWCVFLFNANGLKTDYRFTAEYDVPVELLPPANAAT